MTNAERTPATTTPTYLELTPAGTPVDEVPAEQVARTVLTPLYDGGFVVRRTTGSTLGKVLRVDDPMRPGRGFVVWMATNVVSNRYVPNAAHGAWFLDDPVGYATRP